MLEKYEKKKKKAMPRWLRNTRDLFLILAVIVGFAFAAVVYFPKLPQPYFTIAYVVGMLAVGSFVRSLAR